MNEKIIDSAELETQTALMLAALGNEVRLRIYRLLVRAGPDGMTVGDIQERLGTPASTLSHHIAALRHSGLVVQTKVGRAIMTSANYKNMDALLSYLSEECCADAPKGLSS